MTTQIAVRRPKFQQVCIWPGTLVIQDNIVADIKDFEAFMLENFGTRVQYLEEVITNPDPGVKDSGSRNDLLFAVHQDDIGKFALPRLAAGIRWLEDTLARHKHSRHMYDAKRLDLYNSWNDYGTQTDMGPDVEAKIQELEH